MNKSSIVLFSIVPTLPLADSAHAQIIAIEGNHDLSCRASHTALAPFPHEEVNTFAEIVPVAQLGPSSSQCFVADDVFDANVMTNSNWIADGESVVGCVTKDGHIDYPGLIDLNKNPAFGSFMQTSFIVDMDAANTPFRFSVDWDMLPYAITGDGVGNTEFTVALGDRQGLSHYQLIGGNSMAGGTPNLGPTGSTVFEGISRLDSLRVFISFTGFGNMGIGGCNDTFCNSGSLDQESFVNYELLVGDAALPTDTDTDGIADSADNCTLIANADQRDTNGDGYGNLCDPDLNNDGIVNFADVSLWAPFFNTLTSGDEDFNGDGFANFGDYAIFPDYFLQPPGPSGTAP